MHIEKADFLIILLLSQDGRVAAVYKDLRQDKEIQQMLYDARTLDVFGKVCSRKNDDKK